MEKITKCSQLSLSYALLCLEQSLVKYLSLLQALGLCLPPSNKQALMKWNESPFSGSIGNHLTTVRHYLW